MSPAWVCYYLALRHHECQRLVEQAMSGQYLDSSFSLPCPPGLDIPPEVISPFTSNTLKFLLLLGCFALFWSVYYTLEVTLAHTDLLCLPRRWRTHRGRRRRHGRGVEEAPVGEGSAEYRDFENQNSEEELQAVLDFEAKGLLITGERAAT